MKGDRGDQVRELQERLNKLGFPAGPEDGIFGARTEAALKSFQDAAGREPDGMLSEEDWADIKSGAIVGG